MTKTEGRLVSEFQYSGEPTPMALHHHRGYEIIYVLTGEISVFIGGNRLYAKGPSLLFIDVLDDHDVQVLSAEYERYYLTVNPVLREMLGDRQKLLSLFHKGGALYPAPPGTGLLFEAIREEYEQGDLFGEELVLCRLTELFVRLLRQQPELAAAVREMSPLVSAVRRCIERECTEALTVKALAERFFVSEYHLIRCFKEQTGYTPKQFLTENRLSLAKELLLHTRWGMEQVAAETGFGDAGALIRAFKKANGITPDKYRRGAR